MTFDRAGVVAGARAVLPIALGVAAYGVVVGVLARQAGLSIVEAWLMSIIVFAGSSQFIALGLWTTPLPIVAIIITTFIVNLRYALMGAALRPWFAKLSPLAAYGSLYFMADENWALTIGDFAKGRRNGAFLLGSGLVMFTFWSTATAIGCVAGSIIPDPVALGLDFAGTAVFIVLLVGLWKGKSTLLPWVVAAVVAVAAQHWLPDKWYILLGALAGSIVGVLRHAD